jgi:hypothetical protein
MKAKATRSPGCICAASKIFYFLLGLFVAHLIHSGFDIVSLSNSCLVVSDSIAVAPTRDDPDAAPAPCKTLWFAGFHIGKEGSFARYSMTYAASLESSLLNAPGIVQPVVMLGTYNVKEEDVHSESVEAFRQWAQKRGALVFTLQNFSFQDVMELHIHREPSSQKQGPFLRLGIPDVVSEHKLFELPGKAICRDAVLYTDSDVLFWNVTYDSLQSARDLVGSDRDAYVAYGPQAKKNKDTRNTGVMMMHVQKFKENIPKILDFGIKKRFRYGETNHWHDQDLLNGFFKIEANRNQRQHLPYDWNYKVYWGSESHGGAKIVHFHGMKPGILIECLASMDRHSSHCNESHPSWPHYAGLMREGFQNDGGQFANETMAIYQRLIPSQPF